MPDFQELPRTCPLKCGIICNMKERIYAWLENICGDGQRNAVWLSAADYDALSRSAEDVRQEKFASDAEVKAVLDRYRRR